jgi:2,4-dienoyl-CoA reductase-like NADH-dependent reductase (Old Yellow Enzyme family)
MSVDAGGGALDQRIGVMCEEHDTSGLPVPPFDYKNLKRLFGGLVIANNGFNKPRANRAIADGRADLIAFGKPFIANPDLVIRLVPRRAADAS